MIQFASLEKNIMFPLILAELSRHGNTAALSLWQFFPRGSRLSVCLTTFALHQGHSDDTDMLHREAVTQLHCHFMQTGPNRVVIKSHQVLLVFLNPQDFKHRRVLPHASFRNMTDVRHSLQSSFLIGDLCLCLPL